MPEAARKNDMRARAFFVLIALTIVLGCGGHERAVLLPDHQGLPGALLVKTAKGETLLDQPYKAADVYTDGRIETKALDAETVQQQFGGALSARPPRPVSYILYFITGKDELTPESQLMMEQIKAELTRRPYPEITVIGHTDSVGGTASNDALSLKRAEAMRQRLVEAGISSELIKAAGRGSREMIVPTDAGVSEPRNRRVEINVR
jgi:outer membrane protein OmpA-like peptidoglycan-associated protein